jgi:chloride channel protein, CIC family
MKAADPFDDTLRRVRRSPVVVTSLSRLRSLARRFLVVTLAGVGAMCGVLAVSFERYVIWADNLLMGKAFVLEEPYRSIMVVVTPTVVFTLIALVMRRFAPRAAGANLARVRMAYHDNPSILSPRTILSTFVATPLSLGAGAPLGPEGPIVVVTSGISAAIGRALRLPEKIVRGLIPVGVAAGIAAVFNTPITGVVFALEEVFGAADRGLLGGALIGSVAAAVVERMIVGGQPRLAAPFSTWTGPVELIGFALVGVIAGAASGVAIAAAHRLKRAWTRRTPSTVQRAAMAGLIVGFAGLVAPSTLGVGYDSVSYWLHGGGTAPTAAIAFAIKLLIFIIAMSAGVLGGSFAPSLFIGTALGAAIGHSALDLFPNAGIDPKAYAIIGMGAAFAGLLRSPIAAVLIVIELTRDYDLVVPLMLGVSLAIAISRRISRFSIVEQQMMDEGFVEGREAADPLARVVTGEAMSSALIAFAPDVPLLKALDITRRLRHRLFPVVDQDKRLLGIVSREALEAAPPESAPQMVVREVMERPKLVAAVSDDLISVVSRMRLNGVDRCPVVDDNTNNRLVGFLSPSDILRARQQASKPEHESSFDLFEP